MVVDPNTGFEFNLQLLASKSGYRTTANGKDFRVSNLTDSQLLNNNLKKVDTQQL